ncbi:MAG: hypothetical protein KBC22_00510 [Candidatus Pacebacteria bacterium]|nr:hypothetical protein [Candidatus Paceibacterota bacterium]
MPQQPQSPEETLKETPLTAEAQKEVTAILQAKFPNWKKPSDEMPKNYEEMSVPELKQAIFTATSSLEARSILDALKKQGEEMLPGSPELARLKQLVIAQNYLGQPVSYTREFTPKKSGKKKIITHTGEARSIQGTPDGLNIIVKTKKGAWATPMDKLVTEGQETNRQEARAQILAQLAFDENRPFMTAEGSTDGDEREAYALKTPTTISYYSPDADGGDLEETLSILGAYVRGGNVMGYIAEDADGNRRTILAEELITDIQNGDAGMTDSPDDVPHSNWAQRINPGQGQQRASGQFPAGGFRAPQPVEKDLGFRYIGKFINTTTSPTGYEEITKIKQRADGSIELTSVGTDDKSVSHIYDNIEDFTTNGLTTRHELKQGFQETFADGMKGDIDKKWGITKAWLQVKNALVGHELSSNLSKESGESLSDLHDYLNDLTGSARRTLQNRINRKTGVKYTEAEIEQVVTRYRARFMSGLQVRAEQEQAFQAKEAQLSDTRIGRGLKKISAWWGKQDPRLRATVAYGSIAAMTAFRALSGPAGLIGMAAGMGAGTAMRGIGEVVWRNSDEAEKLQATITQKSARYNQLKQELAALEGINAPQDRASLQRKQAIKNEINSLRGEFTALQQEIEKAAGRINKKRNELAEQYNKGDITVSEYLKKDQDFKKQEARATTIKRLLATIVTIGATYGAVDYIQGLEGGAGTLPEDGNGGSGDDGKGEDIKPEPAPTPEPVPEPIPEPTYDNDAIVRKGEGITHVYERQLDNDPNLVKVYEEKLGMDYESNKGSFLAKLAREHGYIDSAGNDVRVAAPDVSAYELNMDGTVSEFHEGKFIETHGTGATFEKPVDGHEYSWDGSNQYQGGGADGLQPETTPVGANGLQPETTPVTTNQPETTPVNGNQSGTTPVSKTNLVQPETTPVAKTSPENVLGSNTASTTVETAPAILEKIKGINSAETESKLLGQFFAKNTDDHWVLKGTEMHFDNSLSAGYSHADSPQYDPAQNIAKLPAREVFSAMDSGLSAEQFAKQADISVSESTKLMNYFKQLQLLQKDMNLTLVQDTTFGDLTRDIINNANKA